MATDPTTLKGTIDVWCLDDFKASMPAISGRMALAQRLARRLITRRGSMPWWPNDGTDLRQYLLSKASPSEIAGAAKNECKKDEQVEDARVELEVLSDGREILLTILITEAAGPFAFTLLIGEAVLQLVALQEAA
jgi:hypothetical protein